jgi:hypothetical protein
VIKFLVLRAQRPSFEFEASQLRFSFLRFGFVFAGYGGHSIAYKHNANLGLVSIKYRNPY